MVHGDLRVYAAPMEGKIILIRHGKTHFNEQGRLQGRLDISLTTEGKRQTERLIPEIEAVLAGEDDYSLLSSPLARATQTAEIISRRMGASLKVDHLLTEVSFGSWEGLTIGQINSGWPGTTPSFRASWADMCPDGETYANAIERADRWLNTVRQKTIVAVTHGVFGCLIRGRYAQLPKERMLRLPIHHNRIVILSDNIATDVTAP